MSQTETGQTDRTDRQRSDSIGRTVLQRTVAQQCTSPGDGQISCKVWLDSGERCRCSNEGKTRKPLRFAGVPQTLEAISAVSGLKFAILWGHVEDISTDYANWLVTIGHIYVPSTAMWPNNTLQSTNKLPGYIGMTFLTSILCDVINDVLLISSP